MDDPWANAWHEPAKRQPSDAETDIALPSWSTGAAVSWAEPSTDQTSLWVPSEPAGTGWASPYDDIPLGQPSLSVSPPVNHELPLPSTPPEPASPKSTSESIQDPEIRPASPDAFGTFETVSKANEPDLDPWAVGSVVSPADTEQGDVWVPSWDASDHEVKTESPVDEWEEAKRQKARQDEHVPPELLASILDDFKSLSSDLWPIQSPPEDHAQVRSGLENIEGLDSITNRLMPRDLTLPSSLQFSKTFTAKHMGDALRLSRHVPITRLSPFTLYMASKGSTEWEVSVKSRIDFTNDDLLPPGWRVVEKEKEEPSPTVEMKKKGSGGLLSFFGRKSANPSVEANPRRSESPGLAPSISTTVSSSNGSVSSPVTRSTRPSLDSAKSSTHSSTPNLLGSGPVADFTLITSAPSSQITAPGIAEQTPQAPSAVSRFLGRFARNKASGSLVKDSLALSTDDLEFLSDIVPSANDEADENDQLKELSDMLNRTPSSTALPPLLAPPPRAPPTNLVSENLTSQALKSSAHPQVDPFSIFDSPSTMSKVTMPAVQPVIPSLPPSQLPTTSIPPLRPLTSSHDRTESQGAPSSSRSNGHSSSPFDTSAFTARSQTPSSGRRAPIAIMSTGSSSSSNSGSIATLPPAPILPPPPPTKFPSTPSHSRASSQRNIFEDEHELASFRAPPVFQSSLPSDSSTSSVFSDQSLFPDTSSHQTKSNSNLFDDFDDFVSSPIHDPSPPQTPAKPSLLSQPPTAPSPEMPSQPPPQPPTKHPSTPPRKGSRAADYQRTLSLVNLAASRTGRWPAPPSPLPELLPPPPGGPHASSTSSTAALLSSMQAQQKDAISAVASSTSSPSGFPLVIRPPGFSGLQTSTMSPSPPPRLGVASPAPRANHVKNGLEPAPASSVLKYTPSATPGGLSAQDLSFFEGL
ncbi:hypothetical protein E4T56_gene13004 [Termitomyces sp. T112]|nr:hypothetical protein E4T56_gene13004 [Termitomyces sp. T112]